jgi:hypothetical protein
MTLQFCTPEIYILCQVQMIFLQMNLKKIIYNGIIILYLTNNIQNFNINKSSVWLIVIGIWMAKLVSRYIGGTNSKFSTSQNWKREMEINSKHLGPDYQILLYTRSCEHYKVVN